VDTCRATGQHTLARQHAQQALDIYAGLDVPAAAQPRAATAELS